MNEAIFGADQLHGEPQPAKPPAAVPEQGGEFERLVSKWWDRYKACERALGWAHSDEGKSLILAAHNRDMSALTGELNVSRLANESLRKRIAALEAENARLREKGGELCDALNSLVLSVMAHPDYSGEENDEWTDLVLISEEARIGWEKEDA